MDRIKLTGITAATALIMLISVSCSDDSGFHTAYGNYEAVEITVSSEVAGKLLSLNIEEGQVIDSGYVTAIIDTVPLWLKLKQAEAQKSAVSSKITNILSQIAVHEESKKNLEAEKKRIINLLKDKAIPEKQLDEINYNLNVLEKQIEAIRVQNKGVFSELEAMDFQIQQIQDQINRSYTRNPLKGTVIEKYLEPSEIAVPGRAIYKIADLDEIILRVYVDEKQLTLLKLGNEVTSLADNSAGGLKEYQGVVTWVSPYAEFTPKIIQTREERQNLVYAVKVRVKNDGSIKIGMPGEVKF